MKLNTIISIIALLILTGCAAQGNNRFTTGDPSLITDSHGNAIIGVDTEGVDLTDLRPGTEGDFVVNTGNRVLFVVNKHSLTDEARTILRRQAQWLKDYGDVIAVIEGHADERGTREYNLALGARRANAVRDFLIAEGVEASRLDTISYGKERPAVLGSFDAAWAENRRSVTNLQ